MAETLSGQIAKLRSILQLDRDVVFEAVYLDAIEEFPAPTRVEGAHGLRCTLMDLREACEKRLKAIRKAHKHAQQVGL